jgi:hypothetical protein
MDLTVDVPRSAKDKLLGLVSIKRVIDKAKAYNEGRLGEYGYDFPMTGRSLSFSPRAATSSLARLRSSRPTTRWHPEPGSHSAEYFENVPDQIAPERPEIITWFDLLDLDEHRTVPVPTRLN